MGKTMKSMFEEEDVFFTIRARQVPLLSAFFQGKSFVAAKSAYVNQSKLMWSVRMNDIDLQHARTSHRKQTGHVVDVVKTLCEI